MPSTVVHCRQCAVELDERARFCSACGAPVTIASPDRDPLIGRTIGDAYVILDLIGVGGMGRVYRGEQRMLGRSVAIKVIHQHLLADEQSVARFYTEARAASRLNHPNSVSIIDFGRTGDGILYLVMEFLQGRDLARVAREDGPLPFARICEITGAVLATLDEAHALRVVHRDLKPENVIIERLRSGGDLVKVVDFGLAKVLGGGATNTSITLPGLVCGTPDYMSPEQGRGEDMDGRSDVYSTGVLLFELLAERLPYVADTATNVVLRHIQDPIPDPRDVAPQRNIPARLAEIAVRALAKDPADRFARASDMAAALRAVATELKSGAGDTMCAECGGRSPAGKRFCAECGAALHEFRPSVSPRAPSGEILVDHVFVRRPELDTLEALRERALSGWVSAVLVGESGVGKTRLVAALAQGCVDRGDLVVGAGPHPSGAPVAYAPIRVLVASLFGVDADEFATLADTHATAEPLAAAGLRELAEPVGLRGSDGASRSGAVAAALALAIREALAITRNPCAVLIVDDLHRADALSAQALGALGEHAAGLPVLLLVATAHTSQAGLPFGAEVVTLRGMTPAEAQAYELGETWPDAPEPEAGEALLLPLYLDQLRYLGLGMGASTTLPPRLADAVAFRLQRLDASARRVLQAACVLGDRCTRSALLRMVDADDGRGLDRLANADLLVVEGDEIEVVHPFLRDLVEASTPAEARKALHARALRLAIEEGAPVEVRAWHAHAAGELIHALVLLERMGDLATERGDTAAAVVAYRRGFEFAHAELLQSGDASLENALALFGRRVGATLARRGELTGAEGVLREALEFAGASTLSRALLLLELGRVVGRRRRLRDAYRFVGEALEIALQREDRAAEAFANVAVAELRASEANHQGAADALRAALPLLALANADPVWSARVAFRLVEEVVATTSDAPTVDAAFAQARALAVTAAAPYLEARLDQLESTVARARGDEEATQRLSRRAFRRAAVAGDAGSAVRRPGEESQTWPRAQAAARREAS
jgi:serine/threonine-protein kinase